MTNKRRQLKFDRLEDAVADAENLLASGYYKTGNWDLTQCCDHLSKLMLYPINGFPPFPIHLQVATFVMRHTIAPLMLRRILAGDRWPERVPTDHASVPVQTGRDVDAVHTFRAAVDRLLHHDGPWKTSPLFGLLDKETLIHLHRIHTAHHLGFLVPVASEKES